MLTALRLPSHQQAGGRRGWRRRLAEDRNADGDLHHIAALLLLIVYAAPGDARPSHGSPASNGKINGMQLLNGQWGQAKYDSTEALATLESLANQTGASWISMTFW